MCINIIYYVPTATVTEGDGWLPPSFIIIIIIFIIIIMFVYCMYYVCSHFTVCKTDFFFFFLIAYKYNIIIPIIMCIVLYNTKRTKNASSCLFRLPSTALYARSSSYHFFLRVCFLRAELDVEYDFFYGSSTMAIRWCNVILYYYYILRKMPRSKL